MTSLTREITKLCISALLLLSFYVTTAAQSAEPTLHCILLDNSGSLRSQFDRVVAIGNAVVEHAHKQGPISIFSFKSPGGLGTSEPPPLIVAHTTWNQDAAVLSRYIQTLAIEGGRTNLLDAIQSMAKLLAAKAGPENQPAARRVLVLITDGEDRKSKVKEKELIAELQQQQIKVYAIGLVQELDSDSVIRLSAKDKATKFLKKVTKETGGRAVFPKSKSLDVQSLLRDLFTPVQ